MCPYFSLTCFLHPRWSLCTVANVAVFHCQVETFSCIAGARERGLCGQRGGELLHCQGTSPVQNLPIANIIHVLGGAQRITFHYYSGCVLFKYCSIAQWGQAILLHVYYCHPSLSPRDPAWHVTLVWHCVTLQPVPTHPPTLTTPHPPSYITIITGDWHSHCS